MTLQAGIWIDHRQAVLIRLKGERAFTETIESEIDSKMLSSRGPSETGSSEKRRDRRLALQYAQFYQDIVGRLNDIDVLLIMGPGEAKTELLKVISETPSTKAIITKMQAKDNLTKPQLVAFIKEYFDVPVRKTGRSRAK